jgi:hypothetical protein
MTFLHKLKPRTTTPMDWVVEDIPAGTFRVNRAALVDEAVFQGEMRSIFDRCWLYVGHESEIPKPGDFRARDVGPRSTEGRSDVWFGSCDSFIIPSLMEMCLHHPEPLVDAARNLGEHVSRVQVTQLVGLVDALAHRRTERRQS